MPGIFISYRRDDASGHAGRLFDRLAQRFGPDSVFMDVTDIAPGEDFARVIEDSVGIADLLLAMIGPQWLSASDRAGARRLDDPSDFVRREIAAGLHGDTTVIPVLVRGARMPREDELPEVSGHSHVDRRSSFRTTAGNQTWRNSSEHWTSASANRPEPRWKQRVPRDSGSGSGLIVAGLVAVVAMLVVSGSRSPSKKPALLITPHSRMTLY